ncbi:MAG TPA: glycoside hydrolase family 2 TIM barrel-domain containing protein [Chitinophagaceae bacterium]
MKLPILLFLILSLSIAASAQNTKTIESPASRTFSDFNEQWTFNYFSEPKAKVSYESPDVDDSKWTAVAVPHTWSTYETTGELHPYIKNASPKDDPYWWNGLGWYRKKFSISKSYEGKKVFIEFEGVQKNCRVYLNGKIIGEHYGGFTGFSFDLTDYIKFGEENVLAVSVSNAQADDFNVAPMDAGNWDIYGGMYRNVKLVITDKLYVPYQGSYKHEGGTHITTKLLKEGAAGVHVRTWVENDYSETRECKLVTRFIDKNGQLAGTTTETKKIAPGELASFDQSLTLSKVLLWDLDHPNMYEAISEVWTNGKMVDTYTSHFGIREYRWDFTTNDLYLNGKKINMQGFFRHQEYPWLGDAIPDFIHGMDLRDMKENLNCNFIRPGHYPASPALYTLCDKLGMISVGDLPNVKDKDFSVAIQEQNARELVRQQRNHPSIFLWNMGDETNRGADSRWVHEEDTERYISCRDCPGLAPGKYIDLPSTIIRMAKLLRCTIRGWYDDDDMAQRPENGQHAGNEQYEHEWARTGRDSTSNNRIDQPNLIVWLYEDHGCDREYQNAPLLHYNPKGWVDNYRVPKFVYYLWQANYAKKPMAFIHPQFWRPQYVGQKKDIEVDSNCDSIELKINGKSLGILKPTKENFHVVKFEKVPVQKGTLIAVGHKNGKQIIQELKMAGEAARLQLTTSHQTIPASLNSVAIITADITDENNVHVFSAKNTIRWEVTGPATLVGPPVYESDFYKNMEMEGTLYTDMPVSNVIRSTGEPGTITVRVYAAGLSMGEVQIKVENVSKISNGILQLVPDQKSRDRVMQNVKEVHSNHAAVVESLQKIKTGITIAATSKTGYKDDINKALIKNNYASIESLPGYQSLLNILGKAAIRGKGKISPQELNYYIDNYNRFASLAKEIDKTQLPELFKTDLKIYYTEELITKGNEIDIAAEGKKIAKIPANATIVVAGNKEPLNNGSILYSQSTDITAIASTVHPEFARLTGDEKESYLSYVSTINPWIKRKAYKTGDSKLGTKKDVVEYSVSTGRALVFPGINKSTKNEKQ